jgi:uncharacterized protein YpuA (DUF1002 family)
MKKIISLLLVIVMAFALCVPALAVNEGEERVVLGADLSSDQILSVYSQFGLVRGSVQELTVTNAEERDYLEGLVSESIIGTRSISCIYIKVLSENSGLSVTTTNINWCTEDMYKSALMTAGIYDAEVKVGAPFSVSGTAALTGIYKAYEDITGTQLDEEAKSAAADELVITAELADEIDDADAVAIVNDLKLILDETSEMTDDELRDQVEDIAADYGYTLDDELIEKLISLCRSLEGLSIADLQEKVEQFKSTINTVSEYANTVSEYAQQAVTFGQKVAQFFGKIADAFKSIFGSSDE